MTIMRKIIYSMFAGVAVLSLTSCSNDILQKNGGGVNEGDLIEFTATTTTAIDETRGAGQDPLKVSGYSKELWLIPTVEDAAKDVTRGTQLTSTSILQNFGVSAYLHGKTEDITEKSPDFFYNKEAVRDANTGKYSFSQDYYWPSANERLSFMAFAPYGSDYAVLADANANEPDKGPQKINFTVASTVTNQVDLMTATTMLQSPSTTQTPSVALAFEHQLAGIRFVIGKQFPTKGYIQKVELQYVYSGGIYTFGYGTTPGSWEYGSRANFTTTYTADEQLTGVVGQVITKPAQTFLMIPCTFANNDAAKVVIDYWDGYAVHTVEASLADVTWEAGKTYTYELSSQNLTKLKVQSIGFASTVSGAPKTKWTTGDKVGLYVVQGKNAQGETDGHTLRYSNIPVTATVTQVNNNDVVTWSVDHGTSAGNIYKLPGDSYYFYYPYVDGNPPGYPNECNQVDADACTFFSSLISAHTVAEDQQLLADFKNSDLQVAKAICPEDNGSNLPASTVKVNSMSRQVGLARFKFATEKTIYQTITHTYSGANATTQTTNQSGSVKIYPSSNFSGRTPYLGDGGIYFYYTKADEETTFNSNSSDVNKWKNAVTVTLAAGAYTADADMVTVEDYRTDWPSITVVWKFPYNTKKGPYTLASIDAGTYSIECWGADGGIPPSIGKNEQGKGGYTYGEIVMPSGVSLYVFVGGQGLASSETANAGGYNGGGEAQYGSYYPSGGGGATDVRLNNGGGVWNNIPSLKTRIMVAGGGGGTGNLNSTNPWTVYHYEIFGGCGGGLYGGNGGYYDLKTNDKEGLANTSSVGAGQTTSGEPNQYSTAGGFGYAGGFSNGYGGGGGGGWYGGNRGFGHGGSGGSSFISGHPGCDAVYSTNDNTIVHKGPSTTMTISDVEYRFTSTQMIDGKGRSWTTADQTYGNTPAVGRPSNPGNYNGYARITYYH